MHHVPRKRRWDQDLPQSRQPEVQLPQSNRLPSLLARLKVEQIGRKRARRATDLEPDQLRTSVLPAIRGCRSSDRDNAITAKHLPPSRKSLLDRISTHKQWEHPCETIKPCLIQSDSSVRTQPQKTDLRSRISDTLSPRQVGLPDPLMSNNLGHNHCHLIKCLSQDPTPACQLTPTVMTMTQIVSPAVAVPAALQLKDNDAIMPLVSTRLQKRERAILWNRSIDASPLSQLSRSRPRHYLTTGTHPSMHSSKRTEAFSELPPSHVSLAVNSNLSLPETSLISTKSMHLSTPLSLSQMYEQDFQSPSLLSSKVKSLAPDIPTPELPTTHLTRLRQTSYSPSCYVSLENIAVKNSPPISTTSKQFLQASRLNTTSVLSTTTKQSASSLHSQMMLPSTSSTSSHILNEQISTLSESTLSPISPSLVHLATNRQPVVVNSHDLLRSAEISTPGDVSSMPVNANTDTSVPAAIVRDIVQKTASVLKAQAKPLPPHEVLFNRRPRYARGFLWEAN